MILLFDVGATRTRIGLSENGKDLNVIHRFATDTSARGLNTLLKNLQHLAQGKTITAVCGGLPGQIDHKTGILTRVTNMTHWNNQPVRAAIKHVFDANLYLANDVTMGGLGEAHAGAGVARGVMAYFTVSTGVNAVRIVDGTVDHTIPVYDIGRQLLSDGDGKLTSLEELVGGASFELKRGQDPAGVRDGRTWRAEELYLARGVYNTILHWAPGLVVFGGSMMRDIDLTTVKQHLNELSVHTGGPPELAYAKLGDEAGLYGALAYARTLLKP